MSGFIDLLYNLVGICIVILFWGAIYLIYKEFRGQTTFYRWKHLLFSFLGVLILSILTSGMAFATGNVKTKPNEVSSTSSSKTSSSTVSKSSSSEYENSSTNKVSSSNQGTDPADLSNRKLKEYNATMLSGLSEDQEDARNGKDAYTWSLYVDGIMYEKGQGFIVKITPEFLQLSNSDKSKVGNSVQNFSKAQLLMIGEDVEPGDPSSYLNFHYGTKRIGHSKAWDPSEFKWNK